MKLPFPFAGRVAVARRPSYRYGGVLGAAAMPVPLVPPAPMDVVPPVEPLVLSFPMQPRPRS